MTFKKKKRFLQSARLNSLHRHQRKTQKTRDLPQRTAAEIAVTAGVVAAVATTAVAGAVAATAIVIATAAKDAVELRIP